MASILPNTDSLQLGRSFTARLCLIYGATHPTAAPAAIALASSSLSIFDSTLEATVARSYSADLLIVPGGALFIFLVNYKHFKPPTEISRISVHLQKLAEFLSVGRGKQLPTKIRKFCRAEFPCFGAYSAVFTKLSSHKFHCFVS